MKPLLISSGEPAGIGPDLCIALAEYDFPVVILGDKSVLAERAKELKRSIQWVDYDSKKPNIFKKGQLVIYAQPCLKPVIAGQLDPENGAYVMNLLTLAATLCATNQFSGVVTAPVHKANINAAGIPFTGHTEFFAEFFNASNVVMMLACEQMRVALITTHLPLSKVSAAITSDLIIKVITQLHASLKSDFGIKNPYIKVAGLNPHAGESGYLGREEIEVINPALNYLKEMGMNVSGPFPADTLFIKDEGQPCDAYVAMFHDQGLPVLKYAGFNDSVNITLGLPIIRTSVDHGTALDLAGTNKADIGSMLMAVRTALHMVSTRIH